MLVFLLDASVFLELINANCYLWDLYRTRFPLA